MTWGGDIFLIKPRFPRCHFPPKLRRADRSLSGKGRLGEKHAEWTLVVNHTHRLGLPVLSQAASRDLHINWRWHRVPSPPPSLEGFSFPSQPECLLSGPLGLSPTIPMGPDGPGLLTVQDSLHTGCGLLCLLSSRRVPQNWGTFQACSPQCLWAQLRCLPVLSRQRLGGARLQGAK